MQNHYFTLTCPFRDLFLWLREYLEVYPPPGFPNLQVTGDPPLPQWEEVTRSRGAKFYARQPDGAVVLLFEVVGHETHGACRLRLRCHEPSLARWFGALLDRLAPARASGQDQPLPEPPGRSSASALAPAPLPAPATAKQAEPLPAPKIARTGRLAPGRKGLTPEEIEKLRQRWFSRPPGMTVADFCRHDIVSETTLRKYIKDRWG